ncbi:MAG: amino acid adenylation domain-containing protein [Polyangiaceae bacterium]|nr:amino acid adenylation domain-containing protein [Polyangiaceae bacterium]
MGEQVTTATTTHHLAPAQEGMFAETLRSPNSGINIQQVVLRIEEALDLAAFQKAWQHTIADCPTLRTSFVWEDTQEPTQRIHPHAEATLVQHDWQNLSAESAQQELNAFLHADRIAGFDLVRPPLLRLAALQLGPTTYDLAITFHHLLLDGRSQRLLLAKVEEAYRRICVGQQATSREDRAYHTYLTKLDRQETDNSESFWRNLLEGHELPNTLTFGSDLALRGGGCAAKQIQLTEKLTQTLRTLALNHDMTLNTLVQGAWAILLSRYSCVSDIVFGTVWETRPRDIENLNQALGLFINTLPTRVQLHGDTTLLTLLKNLRAQHIASRTHRSSSLRHIRKAFGLTSEKPLFESLVNFQRTPWNAPTSIEQWQPTQLLQQPSCPLALNAYDAARLELELLYDTQRFTPDIIQQMLTHLHCILQAIAKDITQPLVHLDLLEPAERHRMLVEWNQTDADYPQDQCIHHLFETQAQRTPNHIAVISDGQNLTYAQLNQRADRLAAHLRTAGVRRGCYVGIYMNRSADLIVGLLAILKSGGAYVPLETHWPAPRLTQIADCLSMTHCLTQRSLLPVIETVSTLTTLTCIEDTARHSDPAPPIPLRSEEPTPHDIAYCIFTSGSTGQPKGVIVQHQPVVNTITWVNQTFNINTSDKLLFVTAAAFDLSVYDIFGILAAGGCIRVANDEEIRAPNQLVNILRHEAITFWDSAPAALQQLLPALEAAPEPSPSLRLIFLSGDWIPLPLPTTMQKHFPNVTVVGLGGATEAAIWSNYHVIQKIDPTWKSIPYGRPINNACYHILDDHLNHCPVGVIGRLFIGGQCLALGYANDTELTTRKFIPDPFSPTGRLYDTGDLARYFSDGTIELLGRVDNQVKIRGFRVELGEIESALRKHPSVADAAVLTRDLPTGGKQLAAYVVAKNATTLPPSELQNYLSTLLPHYMVPPLLATLPSWPVTSNGKVDRRALLNIPITSTTSVDEPPATELEKRLATIWQKTLRLNHTPNRHENFFALGGDSLLSVEASAIAAVEGLDLASRHIFAHPTIAELAQVTHFLTTSPNRSSAYTKGETIPLTPIQHWLQNRKLQDPQHYNMTFLFDVSATVDTDRLLEAIRQVAHRHDAFALRFELQANHWRQHLADHRIQCDQTDLRTISPDQQTTAIQTTLFNLRRNMDLTNGSLMKTVLFHLGNTRKLGIVVHHLIFDAVSLRIWLTEIEVAYHHKLPTPNNNSYANWVRALTDHATNTESQWLDAWLTQPWKLIQPLPIDFPTGQNTYRTSASVYRTIDATRTRQLLHNLPQQLKTPASELLLAAWGRAMATWSQHEAVLIDVTGHGRDRFLPGTDISATIGYITTNSPAILHRQQPLPTPRPPEQSWGILRYLCSDAITHQLAALPTPQIKFNFQGSLHHNGSLLHGPLNHSVRGALHPANQRAYLLNVELAVIRGELHCQCVYGQQLHHRQRIETLLDLFLHELRREGSSAE